MKKYSNLVIHNKAFFVNTLQFLPVGFDSSWLEMRRHFRAFSLLFTEASTSDLLPLSSLMALVVLLDEVTASRYNFSGLDDDVIKCVLSVEDFLFQLLEKLQMRTSKRYFSYPISGALFSQLYTQLLEGSQMRTSKRYFSYPISCASFSQLYT
jgi:hypothetical protein